MASINGLVVQRDRHKAQCLLLCAIAMVALSVPSYGQLEGQPLVVNSGGTSSSSPIVVDASQWTTSGDVCAQIAAARASSFCLSTQACTIVAPFVSEPYYCSASPFAGWSEGLTPIAEALSKPLPRQVDGS